MPEPIHESKRFFRVTNPNFRARLNLGHNREAVEGIEIMRRGNNISRLLATGRIVEATEADNKPKTIPALAASAATPSPVVSKNPAPVAQPRRGR